MSSSSCLMPAESVGCDTLQAAAARGVKAFGQSTDMTKFAPNTQLSASTDVWGPYYIKRIQDVIDLT